ncbi:MAG TPA: hypothetical protein GXZ45_12535 [Propionibacterium sp.]|nr:hypothetical protein [Propionibacterium sp.]
MTTSESPVRIEPHTGTPVSPWVARLRFGLLALFLAVSIGIVTLGVRPASFTELVRALGTGTVAEVTVVGGLHAGATGTARAEIHWHDGVLPRWTEVQQEVPDEDVITHTTSEVPIITGSLTDRLQEYSPQPITITEVDHRGGPTWYLAGWRVPAWLGIAGIVSGLLTLGLLIGGPEPLMATRWAWFWAITSVVAVVTIPVFLLWGMPRTGAIEQPYTKQGRLTGGWSFLLFSVLAATAFQGLRP